VASIVVVGGGVAGLTCAWQLQREGHAVEVIECEPSAGGRMRSDKQGDFVIERPALRFTACDANLHELAGGLGLANCVHTDERGDAILLGGRFEPLDVGKPLRWLASGALGPAAKARLARLPAWLLRHASRLDPAAPERAESLDDRDAAAGLRPVVGDEAWEKLLAPRLEGVFGEDPTQLSFAAALLALRSGALQGRAQIFSGGNGLLTRTLAESLRVLRGCEVAAIETETDGARVRFRRLGRESRAFADAAVVAVPGTQVAALCPKLHPAERGFFESLAYTREIAVQLLCDREPAAAAYGRIAIPPAAGLVLSSVVQAGAADGVARSGAAVLTATVSASHTDALWREGDAGIAERVRAELARTPIGSLAPVATVVQRWPVARPRFGPGRIRALAAFEGRIERSPRLAFAGDYWLGPRVEAAVTSGLRAAAEITRTLR
jgi:oxygen-dependent protoporphyrinogen oxidase